MNTNPIGFRFLHQRVDAFFERLDTTAGVVAQGSRRYDLQSNNLVFVLREDGGDQMRIEYSGPKPANFDNVTKVVAIGTYNPEKQVFLAKELLVKCPSKYEGRVKGQ